MKEYLQSVRSYLFVLYIQEACINQPISLSEPKYDNRNNSMQDNNKTKVQVKRKDWLKPEGRQHYD